MDERREKGKKYFSWNILFPLIPITFFLLASNLVGFLFVFYFVFLVFFLNISPDNAVDICPTMHVCYYLLYLLFASILSDFSCHYFSSLLNFAFSSTLCQRFCIFIITIMFPGLFCTNLCISKIANFGVVTWTILCLPTAVFISEYLPSKFKYPQHSTTRSIQPTAFSICWEYKLVFSSSNPWISNSTLWKEFHVELAMENVKFLDESRRLSS